MAATTAITTARRDAYFEKGYIILRQLYDPTPMREAIDRLLDRALAGEIQIPWIYKDRRVPQRLAHLLSPDKYDSAFAHWIHDVIADVVESLLDCPARHSLFGMLASGGGQDYHTRWHRDLAQPGSEKELAVMQWATGKFVQFNAPLLPGDRFVQIVPGSHQRPSTEQEIAATTSEQTDVPLANQLTVELEPGDIAFYDANLWHRGYNPQGQMRWSMHAAYWRADHQLMLHESTEIDVMQMSGHLERMPSRTRELIERYLAAPRAKELPTLQSLASEAY